MHVCGKQNKLLRHIISTIGVEVDPEKLDAIQNWPTPKNLTTLRGFLGLTGYYHRFVPKYATIAAGVTDILRKPHFAWSHEAQSSFQNLKIDMFHLITLTLLDFTKSFDITTYASNIAIRAVIFQQDRPIAFFNKRLCNCMQSASAYVRELLS
ncbi:unnamed protein product [Lactuca virosa]|uniref:Reverse transcriptase/retrotransposon-derived protein RNase H-like domain-containing protein n=1 Tax=Lactuca virosa TaxID=75947 RepID=A0AAU9PHT6_9ASTR|nr:unnamed protein product [Lactuca virosa]